MPHRYINAWGRTLHVQAWADETGMPVGTIHQRLRDGWAEYLAVTPSEGSFGELAWGVRAKKQGRWMYQATINRAYEWEQCGVYIKREYAIEAALRELGLVDLAKMGEG